MADRPILFSGPMVRALLDGRKTQTRRALNPQPAHFTPQVIDIGIPHFDEDQGGWGQWETEWASPSWDCPMGEPMREVWVPLQGLRFAVGDRLWVREAWKAPPAFDGVAPRDLATSTVVSFVADDRLWPVARYRQAMHMPRWASRLTLAITDVRVQRLQDLSEADAIAEGIEDAGNGGAFVQLADAATYGTPKGCYRTLWDSLNAKRGYGWDANPWVVAITFTVHRANIDAMPAREAA